MRRIHEWRGPRRARCQKFAFRSRKSQTHARFIHAQRRRGLAGSLRDPQNIFRRIVVHLAVCFDVIDHLDDARLLRRKRRADFLKRPCEIIAVIIKRLIGVLARIKSAPHLIRKHSVGPVDDAFGHFAQKWIPGYLITVQKILQQLRIVIRHFLEMRHAPTFVHRVPVKSAGNLVVHASGAHFLQRRRGHFKQPRAASRLMPFEQQIERRRMREFRRASKPAVARVKHIHDGFDLIVGHARIELSPRAHECFRIRHGFGKAIGRLFHLGAPVAEAHGDCFEDAAESRPSHGILRRKICSAEKRTAVGEKKSGERPATLS